MRSSWSVSSRLSAASPAPHDVQACVAREMRMTKRMLLRHQMMPGMASRTQMMVAARWIHTLRRFIGTA